MKTSLKIGDPVVVIDPGLLMLQRFAPKGAKPNNEGKVLEIWEKDNMILVDFPIGDDDPDEHSQAAPYPMSQVKLNTKVVEAPFNCGGKDVTYKTLKKRAEEYKNAK